MVLIKKGKKILAAMIGVGVSLSAVAGGIDTKLKYSPKVKDQRANQEQVALTDLGRDLLIMVLEHSTLEQMQEHRSVCREFREAMPFAYERRVARLKSEAFRLLESQLVFIPEGILPDGTKVGEFYTIPAVDRLTWQGLMGAAPVHFPKNWEEPHWTWENCPACPVTHVAWEESAPDFEPAEVQDFIRVLSTEARHHPKSIPAGKTECFYSIGSETQRRYANLGDRTGTNHEYRLGDGGVEVSDQNGDDYFWYDKNSDRDGRGFQIQPLGTKKKNAFGLEEPSVGVILETRFSERADQRRLGRVVLGGTFDGVLENYRSDFRNFLHAGERSGLAGVSVVKVCR